MLHRLAIRQALLALDWLLIFLILAGSLFVAWGALNVQSGGGGPSDERVTDGAPVSGSLLAPLGPRNKYDSIVKSHLFGLAGQFRTKPDPVIVPPPKDTTEETELHLKLVGTTATSPTDIYATATPFSPYCICAGMKICCSIWRTKTRL